MKIDDVHARAFAMPLINPSYPPGPYRFYNREFLVITYRTDPDALRAVVPEPLEVVEPIVKYEFIRMPDFTGFGDYTESGQVIPVSLFKGEKAVMSIRCISTTRRRSRAGARSGAFRRNSPSRSSRTRRKFWSARCITARSSAPSRRWATSIRYCRPSLILRALDEPNFLIKIIPHVDGSLRICELVRYHLQDVDLKGAWSGPAALELFQHVIADVAKLPVLEVLGGIAFHRRPDAGPRRGRVRLSRRRAAREALEALSREAAR